MQVSKVLLSAKVTLQPVNEVDVIGTKILSYGSGTATWYKRNSKMVAASNTLPFGTKVNVVNVATGKSVVVTIDDRGIQGSAIIDLSADAFSSLASLGTGVMSVRLEKYYPE